MESGSEQALWQELLPQNTVIEIIEKKKKGRTKERKPTHLNRLGLL